LVADARINIFALKSHNKLQLIIIINDIYMAQIRRDAANAPSQLLHAVMKNVFSRP